VTAEFFAREANEWVDVEVRKKSWAERLFTLVEMGDGFVACKGGTGTLVELAVVWEMLNKGVISRKPVVALGGFWKPIVERVREVELEPRAATARAWGEAQGGLVEVVGTVAQAGEYLAEKMNVENAT
jgi:predicted Rossmann-fold nucleotide-binding protein